MKYGIRKELDWEYVGAQLANEGDVEQIAFLKGFIKECLTWGTTFQVQQQLASVNHGLTKEEKELISMLSYEGD